MQVHFFFPPDKIFLCIRSPSLLTSHSPDHFFFTVRTTPNRVFAFLPQKNFPLSCSGFSRLKILRDSLLSGISAYLDMTHSFPLSTMFPLGVSNPPVFPSYATLFSIIPSLPQVCFFLYIFTSFSSTHSTLSRSFFFSKPVCPLSNLL